MLLAAAINTYITDSINEITDLFENAEFNSKLISTIASNIPNTTSNPKRQENKPKKPLVIRPGAFFMTLYFSNLSVFRSKK